LWDLLQWLEVPMYRLLGGKFRDRIRLYADCHGGEALECLDEVLRSRAASWIAGERHVPKDYFEDSAESPLLADDVRKQAQAMRARGYTALKFDLDVPGTAGSDPYNRCLSNAAIDRMVELVGAAREAVGVEVDLAIDCHWRYNVSDVLKVARELEPFRLLWLEDPVSPGNVDALRAVSSRANIPVATGENLFLFAGFREILQTHAVGIATPDLQKVGGLSVAFQVAQFADEHTIPIAPHKIGSPVGTLAAAHLCAAIPNFLLLEFHAAHVPFWSDLVDGLETPVIQDGFIHLPERPGLGVRLNEEVARQYARKGEPFFQ
jgi:L-alanine-DL-glutamate epimerase-like enolase superfamily enzyme